MVLTLSHGMEYISIRWSDSPCWLSWTGPEDSHYLLKLLPWDFSIPICTSSTKVLSFLQNAADRWLCQGPFAASLEEICELCGKEWRGNLWCVASALLLCSRLHYVPLGGGWNLSRYQSWGFIILYIHFSLFHNKILQYPKVLTASITFKVFICLSYYYFITLRC